MSSGTFSLFVKVMQRFLTVCIEILDKQNVITKIANGYLNGYEKQLNIPILTIGR